MFKEKIAVLLKKHAGISEKEILSLLEIPPRQELGDFAFPCFVLAPKLKRNPQDIAAEISGKLQLEIPKEIERIEAAGAYINFFVNKTMFVKSVIEKILKEKEKYGKCNENKRIVIDYSAPNIGKPMHVGHIRSTILGDSLKKILEFHDNKVIGINYLGDIGLHIGKLIVAYQKWGNDKQIEKNPEKELLKLYVKFCREEKLLEEEALSKTIEQEEKEEYLENEWTKKAKQMLQKIESGDKETVAFWKKIEKYSLNGFLDIYKILNIKFNEITGQSKFSALGKKIVEKALAKKIAIKSKDWEIITKLEPLPDKIILRSDGTALYATQDLGAALSRYEKYKFDKMIYVTGSEQILYFQQLFKILEKLGYGWAKSLVHLPFGLINLEEGKMSSREGRVIFLHDIIEKAKELALKEIEKKNPKLKNKKEVAKDVGLAALKYSILKLEPIKSITFSYEHAINFEGDTGPYLQYTHARACSILKKAKEKGNANFYLMKNPKELELVSHLGRFPEVAAAAVSQLKPHLIVTYASETAKLFNEFYAACPVLQAEKGLSEARIELVKASKQVLATCLNLIGIKALERM